MKLDAGSKGYVTRDDVKLMPGFDKAFQDADPKYIGKLSLQDFKKAGAMYTSGKG